MDVIRKCNGKESRAKKWAKPSRRKSSPPQNDEKKFVRRFAVYKKSIDLFPKNSCGDFNYLATFSRSFNWQKKSRKELKNLKRKIDGKMFEKMENLNSMDKPETKKLFRRGRRENNEDADTNEMWSLSVKKSFADSSIDFRSSDESDESTGQEKIFWKTSKMSLPMTLNEKTNLTEIHNSNMLWRSLNHIQRLYNNNGVARVSEILDVEFKNVPENNESSRAATNCSLNKNFGSDNGPAMRKARLSRWNFLRSDDTRRQEYSNHSKSNPKGFVRTTNRSNADGGNRSPPKTVHDGDASDSESCNCSCCSCEKCMADPTEISSREVAEESSEGKMAPNSEEDQITFKSKRNWGMDYVEKEPLRPPVYNPEDYATSLKKWGRKGNSNIQLPLYLSQSTGSIERISADLSFQNKRQSPPSTKSSSSMKSGDDKLGKKEKDFTLKMDKKDLKNKENIHRGMKNDLSIDFRNPISALSTQEGEMSLRQFSSVTELLGKLKVDLKLAFPSFVQEFVGDPVDGVTLLLELLRSVQLSQASQQQRRPPQIFRRALLDEHSCLICLKHCLRCSDATRRLASSPAGLFTLAVCIMSNVTQSRIIALELLTKACEVPGSGHKAVSDALSTLRLRFGEPVRFRFLVGMLSSAGTIELLASAMKFINVFVNTAPNIQQKVYIQGELEQAGFDAKILRKTLPCNSESVKTELNKWEKSYFDVEVLQNKVVEVNSLQDKIQLLEKRIQILQEEKGILQSLEQCLKERCSELEEEMSVKTNTTTKSPVAKPYRSYGSQQNKKATEKDESTPAEDEGISSSEQELSQDEDYIKSAIPYNNSSDFEQTTNSNESRSASTYVIDSNRSSNRTPESKMTNNCNLKNLINVRSSKMKETNVDDGNEIIQTEGESNEEEETTIDEVIEELENIVNDAETEAYANETNNKLNEKLKSAVSARAKPEPTVTEKIRTYAISPEKEVFEETEIIPSLLHPQPPRKAKSLIHIYFPRRDFDSHEHTKSEFFDEDTDTESSDSLLTATREKRSMTKSCHRSVDVTDSYNSFSSANTRTLFIKQEDFYEDSESNVKLGYEERNIDEEELKRKHLKITSHFMPPQENFSSPVFFKDNKFTGDNKKILEKEFAGEGPVAEAGERRNFYEKSTSFQGVKSCIAEKLFNENPFTRRPQKVAPTPVKRSQTFHITPSDGDASYKRSDVKPKPKMGVSGLDFQRTTDQKGKNEQCKYQSIEYRKNYERNLDGNDRCSRRISKDNQKVQDYENDETTAQIQLCRRGSFDGAFKPKFTRTYCNDANPANAGAYRNDSNNVFEKPSAKVRSKSLEKMDEGLDSMVDIVIAPDEIRKAKVKTELNVEVGKNIGPRTRRSLADSSLFAPPPGRPPIAPEESQIPPKPAQRTSLTRNNSSTTPLHLPREIKLAPVQPKSQQQIIYNFGLKAAKSADSLLSGAKRCPPDGSSNPTEFKANNCDTRKSAEKSVIYSTLIKQPKLQKFFGNPNFENVANDESDYLKSENPISPKPRTIQNVSNCTNQKIKPLDPAQQNTRMQQNNEYRPLPPKTGSPSSKPNFLLGTYQSQPPKNCFPKPSSSVINSINTFNGSFLLKKTNGNAKIYSGTRTSGSSYSSSSQNERSSDGSSTRLSTTGNAASSEKVTDSPSGLY